MGTFIDAWGDNLLVVPGLKLRSPDLNEGWFSLLRKVGVRKLTQI